MAKHLRAKYQERAKVSSAYHCLLGSVAANLDSETTDLFAIQIMTVVLQHPPHAPKEFAVLLHPLLEFVLRSDNDPKTAVSALAKLLFVLAEHISTFEDNTTLINVGTPLSDTLGVHEVRGPDQETVQRIVIKVYDYRHSERPSKQRRRAQFNLEFLPNAKLVVDIGEGERSLQVLQFDYLPGKTHPLSVTGLCFRSAAEKLAELHARGIAHGDVHLFNVLMLKSGEAHWIDFDYACQEKELREYPANWSNDKVLGRHSDARGGEPIRIEHDRHSFCELLKHYQPTADEHSEVWKGVLSELRSAQSMVDVSRVLNVPQVLDAKFSLKEHSRMAINALLKDTMDGEGRHHTGSP
mmetsp:Transcript_14674/g.44057  ORF Transcript_14674/g.44057 Transcript_14674/m.44057 type:complete len:353 (-) Transcript_14674:55-1113(-)